MKLLHIMLSKTSEYVKSYDGQTKQMYFLIEDGDLLKTIILFGIKLALILKKKFNSEPADNLPTAFQDKEIPKADYSHTCLALITIDSILKKDGNTFHKRF